MARPVSELLKNFGKMFEVVKVLVNAVLDMGGNDEDILRILKDKKLAQKFAEMLLAERGITVPDGCEIISVDYALKLIDAIAAAAFDWKNDDIVEKNFPNQAHETGEQKLMVKFYHFGKDMSSEDVVSAMDKDGFRPATLRELLVFAVKNPDEQRKYAIVGLGSVWSRGGNRLVPCLNLGGHERGLNLLWWSDGWGGFCQFLAVRKSS
jgi:hypothetical protein